MSRPVQCVASPGGSEQVRSMTWRRPRLNAGRGQPCVSCRAASPSRRSSACRACLRQTTGSVDARATRHLPHPHRQTVSQTKTMRPHHMFERCDPGPRSAEAHDLRPEVRGHSQFEPCQETCGSARIRNSFEFVSALETAHEHRPYLGA